MLLLKSKKRNSTNKLNKTGVRGCGCVLGGGGGIINVNIFPLFLPLFANTLRRISAGQHPMQNVFGLIYTLKFVVSRVQYK